jgi:LCP family protein required for cell wall assembly
MPETPSRIEPAAAVEPPIATGGKPARRRRGLRIVLVALASVIVLIGVVAVGGYAYVNHEVSSIQRIPVKFTALQGVKSAGGQTILLTSEDSPTGSAASTSAPDNSGLIMLLHINANQKAGGVVSIPPQTEVQVPGRGKTQLKNVTNIGGPSLLVQTVQSLTGVPINHYSRIDFTHAAAMINALGGVTVTMPAATKISGQEFRAGANQLNGTTAVSYTRQSSLTEQQRVLRQQSLMRAMLTKLAHQHLLTNPVTAVRVTNAITKALTVDSNFSNSQIEKLVTKLGALGANSSTFITAPVSTSGSTTTLNKPVATQLWNAMNHDTLATFAKQHPATVTPAVVK